MRFCLLCALLCLGKDTIIRCGGTCAVLEGFWSAATKGFYMGLPEPERFILKGEGQSHIKDRALAGPGSAVL